MRLARPMCLRKTEEVGLMVVAAKRKKQRMRDHQGNGLGEGDASGDGWGVKVEE
jgi:hypothetical protein